jgi:hypothetical protein
MFHEVREPVEIALKQQTGKLKGPALQQTYDQWTKRYGIK